MELGSSSVKEKYVCIFFMGMIQRPLSKSSEKAHSVLITGQVLLGHLSRAIVLFQAAMVQIPILFCFVFPLLDLSRVYEKGE